MKNKDVKRVLFNFMPYECTALEEFLEEEASKGWLLTSIRGNVFKFKRIEPKNLKFTVDIFGDLTLFDDENNEVLLSYRDYCKEAGWEYVCSKGKIQIFYTEDYSESIPIHTDEKEKFKHIVRASISNISGFVVLVALWIFIIYQWLVGTSMFESIVSSNVMLIGVFIYNGMIFYYLVEIIALIKWGIKSKISLKENKFIPYNSYKTLKNKNRFYKVAIILALIYIVTMPIIDNSFSVPNVIYGVAFPIIFILLFYIVIKFLKKKNFKKRTNIIITILSFIVIYILLINFTVFNMLGGLFSNYSKKNDEYIANLTLDDFGYKEISNDVYGSKSIIAENRSYFSEGEGISFFYDTFICNNNWVFKICVDKEVKSYGRLAYEVEDKGLILETIDTKLPKDVIVYSNNNELGKRYLIVGENKYVSISNKFENLGEEEFLNIIYDRCFKKQSYSN